MRGVTRHLNRMECYTCHASWTPQCYGCHVKIDYSQRDKCPECQDSLRRSTGSPPAGSTRRSEHRADRGEAGSRHDHPRQGDRTAILHSVGGAGSWASTARAAFRRWRRCQVAVTVIGEDGKPIILNHIFRTLG